MVSCCAANDESVEGEGTTFAEPSSDCGRDLTRGMEKLLAKAANDGKEVGEAMAAADGPGDVAWTDGSSGEVGDII